MLQNAEVIGAAVQRMQSWIIHDMALCFADTETDAEESLFQTILSARWSVEKRGRKILGSRQGIMVLIVSLRRKVKSIFWFITARTAMNKEMRPNFGTHLLK